MTTLLSITSELHADAYRTNIPLNVTFEITLHCNIKCAHCYNFDREEPHPTEMMGSALMPAEIHRIIDEVRDEGCLYIGFTGGEVVMHPDLDEFVRHADRRHMVITIKSNGTLYTADRVRRLADAGASYTDISVHGATPRTHDGFTGIPGSFEKTVRGIQSALDGGLQVRLSFSLTRYTAHEITEMRALADRLGVKYSIDPHITGRYDGNRNTLGMKVDRDTLMGLYEGPLRDLLGEPKPSRATSVQCSCARGVCGITATGIVYPCIGAPVPSGNLRRQPFHEIWTDSPVFRWIRGLTLDDFPVCRICPDRFFCRRSSGVVYSNTENYTGPEEWTCMEAGVLRTIYEKNGNSPHATETSGVMQRHTVLPE